MKTKSYLTRGLLLLGAKKSAGIVITKFNADESTASTLSVYHQTSNKRHQIPKLKCFLVHFAVYFAQSTEARCSVENEDAVGTAPAGDAPTASEWSTILMPTKVSLILEVL